MHMLIKFLVSVLVATVITTNANASPILEFENGQLIGAKNIWVEGSLFGVDVAGEYYDVKFASGSCDDLFNGCNKSQFTFRNLASAGVAAHALLDQVFVDSTLGAFDSNPSLTAGCTADTVWGFKYCQISTPWELDVTGQYSRFSTRNFGELEFYDSCNFHGGFNYQANENELFALWTKSSTVPEPNALVLFAFLLGGIIIKRKVR